VQLQSLISGKRYEKKVTVIGGNGKMGKWIQRYFRSLGSDVNAVDVSEGSIGDAEDSDAVVISVPISSVGRVLKEVDEVCRKDALIFDISSVKTPFILLLKEMSKRRKVCSVHPMFGPSAATMNERNVMICDCGCAAAVSEAKGIFDNDGANVVVTDIERHDVLMSYVLAFAHASNIVFFTALRHSGICFDELEDAASSTFSGILRTSVPVSRENASLYHEIQFSNANSEEMWKVFENAVIEVRDASLSKDPERFAELMEKGKEYFGDHR
jgi:chorismate mutase/prephenate dehydrogenase